jgi:hypothetical protein
MSWLHPTPGDQVNAFLYDPLVPYHECHGSGARLRRGSLSGQSYPARSTLPDLAILTLGHAEHLGDVVAGYGAEVDLDVIRAWWSFRSLQAIRWLIEHGFDPFSPGCEVDVLRSCSRG